MYELETATWTKDVFETWRTLGDSEESKKVNTSALNLDDGIQILELDSLRRLCAWLQSRIMKMSEMINVRFKQ